MFGISGFELLIIAAFALIILGPDKIPGVARTVGRFMRQFKRTQEEMEAMVRAEMYSDRRKEQGLDPTPKDTSAALTDDFVDDEEEEEEEE